MHADGFTGIWWRGVHTVVKRCGSERVPRQVLYLQQPGRINFKVHGVPSRVVLSELDLAVPAALLPARRLQRLYLL